MIKSFTIKLITTSHDLIEIFFCVFCDTSVDDIPSISHDFDQVHKDL